MNISFENKVALVSGRRIRVGSCHGQGIRRIRCVCGVGRLE